MVMKESFHIYGIFNDLSFYFPLSKWEGKIVGFQIGRPDVLQFPFWAVVVIARADCGYVLANIPGRGWTVPSGRIEQGESVEQAAVRETMEEIGAFIMPEQLHPLGYYLLWSPDGEKQCAPLYAVQISDYGQIPDGSESKGVRCAALADLPSCYWTWDELMENVFIMADDMLNRKDVKG
jgi:hypothetical protein